MDKHFPRTDCWAEGDANIEEILWDESAIRARVEELGAQISSDYRAQLGNELERDPPVAIGLLHGAFIFMADLIRAMSVPIQCDFIHVSSYGQGSRPGDIRIVQDVQTPIRDRHVLIVEDIVDTGQTFDYLRSRLGERHPASIKFCAFIDKTARRTVEVPVDYAGFRLDEDAFLVGYGLDYAEKHRNLTYIAALKPEAM